VRSILRSGCSSESRFELSDSVHQSFVLSFMSRLMRQRTHADSDPASAEYRSLAVMDFLTNHLFSEDRQELLGLIEDYRQGLVPLT